MVLRVPSTQSIKGKPPKMVTQKAKRQTIKKPTKNPVSKKEPKITHCANRLFPMQSSYFFK
ncbi:hypothetical protein RUM_22370 [Ruminococcus champanellensis 18P13 = JCM 17042]|uniref:Uncharacterized protein n=1 Tax=Ruminococcus champanellensis (strain DSM 18848 / JCM 17042 / KCTC 15320 / 18P13) TaxID=213810 RepID=D4LF47_RUMC1|nr:hypothetical protein RUM_22370 [Ruminococcus champanellensis 18P13 = JCM 17042]